MRRFYVEMENVPEQIAPERRTELVKDLRDYYKELLEQGLNQDEIKHYLESDKIKEINELINGHLRLAISITGTFSAKFYKMDSRMNLSVAIETLVDAVHNFIFKSFDDQIDLYIAGSIWNELKDSVDTYVSLRMPVRTVRHIIKVGNNESGELIEEAKGKLDPINEQLLRRVNKLYQYDLLDQAIREDNVQFERTVKNFLRKQINLPKSHSYIEDIDETRSLSEQIRDSLFVPVARQEEIGLDLKEVLNKVTYSPFERKVLQLAGEGYNLEEIAAKVGWKKSKIGNILSEIERRFIEIWDF
jgi:hypothetical protein